MSLTAKKPHQHHGNHSYGSSKSISNRTVTIESEDQDLESTPPKRRKLSESDSHNSSLKTPSRVPTKSPKSSQGLFYNVGSQIVLGSPPPNNSASNTPSSNLQHTHNSTQNSHDSINQTSNDSGESQANSNPSHHRPSDTTNAGKILSAHEEDVIHFTKKSLRDTLQARPYPRPGTNSDSTSKSTTDNLSFINKTDYSTMNKNEATIGSPSFDRLNNDGTKMQLPPWAKQRYPPGVSCLNDEIWDFFNYLQPTREERMMRFDLVERVRALIQYRWPQTSVHYFGSFATDLLLPTSDIDIVVLGLEPTATVLFTLRSLLQKFEVCKEPTVISHAKVPLVKFCDSLTTINVDISFNQANGLQNTKVINGFAMKFRAYRPLLLVIKYLLQQRAMNEPYNGGLGSYALSLMVASFLQMHPKTNNLTGETDSNLGFLLVDFLGLYGKHFNYYATGISVLKNGSYFSKIQRGWIDHSQPFLPSIEDPNDTSNDVGRSSFRIMTIRSAFKDAYAKLVNSPVAGSYSSTLLCRILTPNPAIEHNRTQLTRLCKLLLQNSPIFAANVQPVVNLYDENGALLPGAQLMDLCELVPVPAHIQTKHSSNLNHHLMFNSDSEQDLAEDQSNHFTHLSSDESEEMEQNYYSISSENEDSEEEDVNDGDSDLVRSIDDSLEADRTSKKRKR